MGRRRRGEEHQQGRSEVEQQLDGAGYCSKRHRFVVRFATTHKAIRKQL
jgi:hypothetical protein